MPTEAHVAGPLGQRSPGLDLAIAGYLAENPPAGGGVELVSGVVDLDGTGSPVRKFYCTASATIEGVAFSAGDTVVFRRTPAGVWGYIVVDPWTDITGTTTTTTTAAATTTTTTASTTTTTTTASTTTTTTTASGWLPSSLASLQAWFDASDAGTITASGGVVSQWNDKSGGAHHLTVFPTASGPTVGTNAIIFNGTSQTLGWASPWNLGSAESVFVVATIPATASYIYSAREEAVNGSAPHVGIITGFNGTAAEIYGDHSVRLTLSASGTGTHLLGYVRDNRDFSGRFDGAAAGTDTAISDFAGMYPRTLGSGYNGSIVDRYAGSIKEVVICNAALSGADLTSLETYLKTKWGIA